MSKPASDKATIERTITAPRPAITGQERAEFALDLLQADPLAHTLTLPQLRQLRSVLAGLTEESERLTEQLNALGEIPAGTFFGLLLARLKVGTGYFRDARFTLDAFFRARARGESLSDLNSHIEPTEP